MAQRLPILPRSKERRAFQRGHDATKRPRPCHVAAGVLDGPGCSMGRGARWAGVLDGLGCSMGRGAMAECEKLPVQRSIARVKRPFRPWSLVRSMSKTDLPVQQPVQ